MPPLPAGVCSWDTCGQNIVPGTKSRHLLCLLFNMYKALMQRGFRLLCPLEGDDFAFALETHEINEAPTYVALSYTWGPAPYRRGRPLDTKYNIKLNGEVFSVQENLHDALRHMFRHLRSSKYRLYVDAVSLRIPIVFFNNLANGKIFTGYRSTGGRDYSYKEIRRSVPWLTGAAAIMEQKAAMIIVMGKYRST
ncbi:hypothetical protein NA57DRAFT_57407 [Rhizodiscina lignyota]|uniref:Heterokaryon incompatibility domain-containing protein n=1 Tax=Rhizodiscina lignyota TaxID=1504668 RepID=A0A9P4M5U5_9PEZI|nr:hypothetical protein NA57DRAFT_57407 [Rhizodiscina lignyota]